MKLDNRCSYGRVSAKAACFLLAGVLLLPAAGPVSRAQGQPGGDAAAVWNTMRSREQQRLAAMKAALENAQVALAQAQASLQYAEADTGPQRAAAIAVSQRAVAEDQETIRRANFQYSEELASWRLFEMNGPLPQDLAMGEPVSEVTHGDVKVRTNGDVVPLPAGKPLPSGGEIQTGKDGSAFLYLAGGHGVFLAPETTLRVSGDAQQGEALELLHGAMHVVREAGESAEEQARQIKIYLLGLIIGTRGTEFDVRADGHVLPYSGEITITPRTQAAAPVDIDRWWQSVMADGGAAQPLPASALAEIVAVKGEASIAGGNVPSKPAAANTALDRGERIETADGFVLVQLRSGYRAVIGPHSSFEATTQGASGLPLYALLAGRLYTVAGAGGDDAGIRFVVPNAVVSPTRAEFAVSVGAGQLSDFVPLGGSLDIRARDKPLDFNKIPSWWEVAQ